MAVPEDRGNLATDIMRCRELLRCKGGDSAHPCAGVVGVQNDQPLDRHQVPEPWVGNLAHAPILFVSSNPSIADVEPAARWFMSDLGLLTFFENRFGPHGDAPGGVRLRNADGTPGKAVPFWREVRSRAAELLNRDPVSGEDYALTEVVHCKSTKEIGVRSAMRPCAARYLRRVLNSSGARVVVVLGAIARAAVSDELALPVTVEPAAWEGRLLVALPHPNAHGYRSFERCVSSTALTSLRDRLNDV